ncbi:MAG: hypothetical protein H7328_07645 [Bdellovibrio sp.]|nr:hypothetical protein [Bdellovibrio sp.]
MKLITIRNLIFLGLAGTVAAIAACSSGSGIGSSASLFGLPKVEMKCNGQACIQ